MAVVVPTLPEIFEEAFERAGVELRAGYDLASARRSLNLVLLEWQNRGLNAFTISSGTQVLTPGTATYTLPAATADLIEYQMRTGSGTTQTDYNLTRLSVSDYAKLTNKNHQGMPLQLMVTRAVSSVSVTFWPVPDSAETYTFAYYSIVGADGLASGIGTTAGVSPRFVPALIAGLALNIAMKRPEAANRIQALEADYEKQYSLAAEGDRETATLWIRPWGY